jgi:hypothetical protein
MCWFMRIFARHKIYDDLSDEIEEHLAEKTDTLMAAGASREEAERAARREFGNVTRIKERSREPWRWPRAEVLWSDVRFAIRKLGKSPGFTATAVSTLALGIGANVVVFSVLYGLVLRPLDVPQLRIYSRLSMKDGPPSRTAITWTIVIAIRRSAE